MLDKFVHLFWPHRSNNLRPKILHLPSLTVLLALFAFAHAGIGWVQKVRPDILGYASQIPVETIVSLTNSERAKYNLPQLQNNAQLADAARRKASDMFANNYWAHYSPTGVKPWYFINAAGYTYLHAGENLARDFSDPDSVINAWMNSPTHRDNVLSPKYQDIGVAVVDGQLNGVETTLVVQMFGTLASSAPQVNAPAQAIAQPAFAQEPTVTPAVAGKQTAPAAESPLPTPTPTPTPLPYEPSTFTQIPLLNTFDVSRSVSLAFALLLLVVLAIDWLVAWQQNLIRISGKNWAHITYLVITIILGIIIKQGLVL
jgi:hypothetical protein